MSNRLQKANNDCITHSLNTFTINDSDSFINNVTADNSQLIIEYKYNMYHICRHLMSVHYQHVIERSYLATLLK